MNEDQSVDLEMLKSWLLTFPQWDAGQLLFIDRAEDLPGVAGLFPAGVEEVSRRKTVTGSVRLRNRCRFILYRVCGEGDSQLQAQWLSRFQAWVQQQSALGLAPAFGDDPQAVRILAEKGSLKSVGAATVKYAVVMSIDYVKIYES